MGLRLLGGVPRNHRSLRSGPAALSASASLPETSFDPEAISRVAATAAAWEKADKGRRELEISSEAAQTKSSPFNQKLTRSSAFKIADDARGILTTALNRLNEDDYDAAVLLAKGARARIDQASLAIGSDHRSLEEPKRLITQILNAPRPKAAGPAPASGTIDDEGVVPVNAPAPSPDDAWLGDVISSLQAVIDALRTRLPSDDEAGEPEARAVATIIATTGMHSSVLPILKKAIAKKTAKIAARRDPRFRVADAFGKQSAVAALDRALGKN